MAQSHLGETIRLGGRTGVVINEAESQSGLALFSTPAGPVSAYTYQARTPDVLLNEVAVCLIEEQEAGQGTGRYALMVDDAYWGRRIQPAAFRAAPFSESFMMGYRLAGIIQHDGVPQEGARVSLRVTSATAEDGEVVWWDSEEYNTLVWSYELETYVTGPTVTAPIVTDEDGYWTWIAPRGHGAIYQRDNDRRDDSGETAVEPLARYVALVQAAYRGAYQEVREGETAVLDWMSGRLRVTALPGAVLRVGWAEDGGEEYHVPPEGVVEVTGLPRGPVSVVQFRQSSGAWDPSYGCPRVRAWVEPGETTELTMPDLEAYPPNGSVLCGRIYECPGVPAEGVGIVVIDPELGEIVGTVATSDSTGFWSVTIPENGLGGLPYIMDETWGSVPVLGLPYSDIVLGARAYAHWGDLFRPEAWRTGLLGHKNFAWVAGSVWVYDNATEREFATEQAPWGGWITREALPKYQYVADPMQLLLYGPQLRSYRLEVDGRVEDPAFHLRGQSFSDWAEEAGNYRASGYYPEKKILVGGKLKHNVVRHGETRLTAEEAEAVRVGLEFGELQPYTELRAAVGEAAAEFTCYTDLLCPYCGGPLERSPGGTVPRGYCRPCAAAWETPRAMDGRSFARSATLSAWAQTRRQLRAVALTPTWTLQNRVRYHWRPDLYEESDEYLVQGGPGQESNAPRWFAKHVHEVGDGRGLGQFDGDASPGYVAGHDLEYFGGLVERELGLAQFKLCFPEGYTAPQSFTLEVDCERADDEVETLRVTVPSGTRGPNELDPLGEVIPLSRAPKLAAEGMSSPYAGVGLYRAITDIRLVEPESAPGCQCTVTNDVPLLASPEGVPVPACAAQYVALQLVAGKCRPHLLEDAVGRLHLFRGVNGNIEVRTRKGLLSPWEAPRLITSDGASDYPWAGADERGTLILVRQRGAETVVAHSRDGGLTWEEV